MNPDFNNKQYARTTSDLEKGGSYLGDGSSIASGHDLILTTFFTEET